MAKILCCLIFALAVAGVSFAQQNVTDEQPSSCKCPPPPPPPPRGGPPGEPKGQDDMDAEGDDMAPPPPPPPHDQNMTGPDGKARPPPPPPPKGHHGWHKGPKEICGTDGKTYADKCQFTNAQFNDSKLGERPCPPPAKPHCLNNGTTVNIDRKELDKILKSSPISLGVLCPGPCPCKLECPPPPPPPKGGNHPPPPPKDKHAPPPPMKGH